MKGKLAGGGLSDLEISDDSTLRARKRVSQVTGGVTIEFKSTSSTDDYEVVDTRIAGRTDDIVAAITPTGGLSRFVQPGTRCIEARVQFVSAFQRQRYVTRIDQIVWTITN